jgi:hypothetical protein
MGFFYDSQPPFPLFVSNPRLSNNLRKLNHKWDEIQTTESTRVDLQRLTTTGICLLLNSFRLNVFPNIELIV